MKYLIKINFAIALALLLNSCGPTIYKSQGFDVSRKSINTLAIVPFSVSIDSKRLPKGVTLETLQQSEQKTGYDIQDNSYKWFLKRKKDYSVEFQDIDKTNALLKKANITYENFALTDKSELCKILGVDGIISGKTTLSKPMSDGAAIALGVLVGAWGATNSEKISISIHDSKSDLLWKYDYVYSGGIGSSTESLIDGLMRNASKKFPYKYK